MSSNSDDIQATGSDTRPPMLDRTYYDSWSQRIHLYCRGKENEIYILQSIDHGPFELGTTRDTLGTTPEGDVLLGPKRPHTYDDLNDNDKKRFDADVRATNIVLQVQDGQVVVQNVQGQNNQNQRNFAQGNGAAGNGGAQNRAGNAYAGQGKPIKCYNCNGLGHIAWNCTQLKCPQNSNYFKDKMLLMQDQKNGAVLDEEELLFLAGEQTNTFDADVDNQPVRDLALNEDNIIQADESGPSNLQVGPFNASILSEVHDLENAIDPSDNYQVEHEIHDEVQQKNVIESTSADMGNSNVIPYEQYLMVNDVSVVPSSASSVPNDAYVLHDNDAYVPPEPLAIELNIYKEQVAIYEQCAKFELTLHEQKMDEQMSILIRDHNKKEENLKKELNFVKLQLNSTIKNNKIIEETLYDQDAVTAIGVQNPFYLRKAKKAQPTLYDGDERLKMHHVPIIVTSSEEDPELAETTRIKMNEKINDSVYVEKRVKIIPPNYSKEKFMATFTPQTQLTPEQVFWSNEIKEKKAEDLKAKTSTLPVLPPAIVYPPNTPVHLVPRTLPTTSQVNIGLYLKANKSDEIRHLDYKSLDSQNLQLKETITALQERLENFKAENEKVKQHYQELFNSIKITHVKTIEKTTSLQTEIENLKTQLKGKLPCVTSNVTTPKVFVFEKHAIDVDPLPHPLRNNRSVHNGYLHRHKDTLDTLYETVEEARSNQPSDNSLEYACIYTKHSHELLEYVNASCPNADNKRVSTATIARRSQPKSNTTHDKTSPANSVPKKKVEDHPRKNKSKLSKQNRVDSSTSVRRTIFNTNSNSLCKTCHECIISFNHDKCVEHFLKSSKTPPVRKIWRVKQVKQTWKPTNKVFAKVAYHWKPTSRIIPLGEQCPLTRITKPKVNPVKQWKPTSRLIPLGEQCPLVRHTAPNSGTMLPDP
ncbi:retrovirus-related pol polyprotein from transposon TNT 1-94 [Tanacetum coccineum]